LLENIAGEVHTAGGWVCLAADCRSEVSSFGH